MSFVSWFKLQCPIHCAAVLRMPGSAQKRKFASAAGRIFSTGVPHGEASTSTPLKFGDSRLFDFLFEKARWGHMSMQACADIAELVVLDNATFRDLLNPYPVTVQAFNMKIFV